MKRQKQDAVEEEAVQTTQKMVCVCVGGGSLARSSNKRTICVSEWMLRFIFGNWKPMASYGMPSMHHKMFQEGLSTLSQYCRLALVAQGSVFEVYLGMAVQERAGASSIVSGLEMCGPY